MMEEAQSAEKGIRHSIGTIVSATASWVFLSAVLAMLFTIVAIEWTTLGSLFIPRIYSAWAMASLAGALLTFLLERQKAKRTRPSNGKPLTRRQVLVLAIGGLLMVSAMLGVGPVKRELEEKRNAVAAEEARGRFAIILYPGPGPGFNPEAVNQTLRELEESFHRLQDIWVSPETADKIRVWLFRNLQDYQTITGNQDASGHASCPSEFGPTIVIPLERAPSTATDDNFSRTPMHEMVHALMCQSLGREDFYSMPRWFLEGMAERYEMEGIARIMFRVERRAMLWLSRHNLMVPDRFCARRLRARDGVERALFYETSREFVNSLEARHGIEALNLVVDDIRRGATFNESMEKRMGGSCNELYMRWKGSF